MLSKGVQMLRDAKLSGLFANRTKNEHFFNDSCMIFSPNGDRWGEMSEIARDFSAVVRLSEYCRELERLHLWGDDDDIDREFNAVCRGVWSYTCDDFDDDTLSADDHAFLDNLTNKTAYEFALENGYDLADYNNGGYVSDWWGFAWMILAEKRGLFTPEQRTAAWAKHDAKLLTETNVIGVIHGR
jgi:hypothetical protein